MSSNSDFIFKIGIVGPTRVGKTSLIAAILKDGQSLLQGTPVSIGAFGTKTERRLAQHHKELEGSIRVGEFNSGAVSGTEESFKYELHLDPGVKGAGIRFGLLDYPGGWIDASRRPEEREEEWKGCKLWMKESSVLIVPVESAVMMEADTKHRRRSASYILNTVDVEQVVREWAKNRAAIPHEPALLIFCPVKCESYFADNGGLRDNSQQLFKAFEDHYHEVLKAVRGEAPQAKLLYLPVDTIGCVEITRGDWQEQQKQAADVVFQAVYRVRRPHRQAVKGADAVLVSLFRHLVEAKRRGEIAIAEMMDSEANAARKRAEKSEGTFGDFWLWLSNERERRRIVANNLHGDAFRQLEVVKGLDQTIASLAQRELGSRVKEL
jgi:hypothetical protein